MADLHAALLAAIEERERLHRAVLAQHPLPWEGSEDGLIWSARDAPGDPVGGSSDPDVVQLLLAAAEHGLRGCAEDRDILRRHVRDHIYDDQRWHCCVCADGDAVALPWPCPDVLSVARRHGIEA